MPESPCLQAITLLTAKAAALHARITLLAGDHDAERAKAAAVHARIVLLTAVPRVMYAIDMQKQVGQAPARGFIKNSLRDESGATQ